VNAALASGVWRLPLRALIHPSIKGGISPIIGIRMPIKIGTRVGSFEITSLLGRGGMGEVYRARDERLKRDVAIKILPEEFSRDAGRIARFQREAEALAALNHQNIGAIYDLQESEGTRFLVLELAEGHPLSERLKKGPLPSDLALRYGGQIAGALAAAHAKGIIHRDLKPGNIMITPAGVKVLDFGLAWTPGDRTLTQTNVVMGTPAYMAPEQREGKEAAATSDIYALGLILREMASGKQKQEVPDVFTHIVQRCLEPDPADRWQAASDIRKELEWAASNPAVTTVKPVSSWRPWIIATFASALLAAVGIAMFRRDTVPDTVAVQFTISRQEVGTMPLPSPNGRYLVFHGPNQGRPALWIRPLDSVDARILPGTEGAQGAVIWSPDSEWIGFYSGGKLKKVSLSGGVPQTIAELPGFQDAAWGSQGDIIFRTTNRAGLFRVREGGSPQPLTTLNAALTENSHRFPQFLPDGRRFLFVSRCGERANNALYIGSLDSPDVKRLMPAQSRVAYVPGNADRHAAVLYYLDGALVAQPFDVDGGGLTGSPTAVFDQIGYNAPSIEASFVASADGTVIVGASGADEQLTWFDRNGEETGTLGPPGHYGQPRISHDGSRVAFQSPDPETGNRDIWYTEVARGITSRLTSDVANDWYPVWSPDGKALLFGSDRDGGLTVVPYLKTSLDLGSSESRLGALDAPPFDWSTDEKWIVYGSADIKVASASDSDSSFKWLATPAAESDPRFSPDTRWIAYSSNQSGRMEVYARPFTGGPAATTGLKQVSTEGGGYPVWAGKEIFYMTVGGEIFSVNVASLAEGQSVPAPVRLFQACRETGVVNSAGAPYNYPFDTRDGQRFLVVCSAGSPGDFTVWLNWKWTQ
jgi:eukaryotic-like serine/threonine-protein kinase